MKFKNYIIMFITLFGIWLLLNNSLAPEILMSGLLISILLPFLFCGNCQVFTYLRITPKSILYTFLFLFTFLIELVKSNFDVARRVISPSLPINPGIVEVKTKLKSKIARVVLADSITLTPGTFTLEIVDDSLFIHWIDVQSTDVEKSTKLIVEKFEKYLEVMYG
jgi:multicomponent Na+:H+ antiporter subunit E